MSLKPGEASAKVLRDLKEIMRYYKPTECYKQGTKVDCRVVALELIEDGKIEEDLTVCNRRKNVCLSMVGGSQVQIAEILGFEVYLQVDIGDYVRAGDILAYVVTSKGEVRSKRSNAEGYVVMIYEDPASKPLKYFIALSTAGAVVSGS